LISAVLAGFAFAALMIDPYTELGEANMPRFNNRERQKTATSVYNFMASLTV
jgi:hypothetical protein